MTLDKLPEGKSGYVIKINLSGSIRERILDLGLIENTKVKCVYSSPKNDPRAYRIRGALIALRNSDTSKIEITTDSGE